jgi:hypothetical protein
MAAAVPPAAAAAAIIHDLNGEYYVVGQQGEIEQDLSYRHVIIRETDATLFPFNTVTIVNTDPLREAANRIRNLNYWHLKTFTGDQAVTNEEARKIAFLRAHAVSVGWADTTRNLAAHNVRYTDVELVPDNQIYAVPTGAAAGAGGRIPTDNHTAVDDVPDWHLDIDWRTRVKPKIMNMVCMVAFFMRTRGHHYTADTEARFKAIWRNCLYEEDEPGLSWEKIAHHVYHFIYPDKLDAIWIEAASKKMCAGALQVRINSSAAGVAVVGAVQTGADDVAIIFPALRGIIPDAFDELERCKAALNRHRWAGSINRRYYNGPELIVNERAIGSLAAVILGALQAVSGTAPLRSSPALKRAAQNAPITGTLIVQMITKAATDDRMVNSLFLETEDAE